MDTREQRAGGAATVPPRGGETGKIAIVGAGIAGLCAAVYARKCGYDVDVFEQHDTAGGLATSWRREPYTFETSLVWLLGSKPGGMLHEQWREVFDIEALPFVDPSIYARIQTDRGESLNVYADVDSMEDELLRQAPGDAKEIRRLTAAVRRVSGVEIPEPGENAGQTLRRVVGTLPAFPVLARWSRMTLQQYARRFKHPLLRAFIADGENGQMSSLALLFALAWMNEGNAGYPIGGSQAVIGAIAAELQRLGGRLHLGAAVDRILVEGDAAAGVRLANGEAVAADWVISAADGHHTIYDLLGGRYTDARIDGAYRTLQTFPSYAQVSLGVALDLSAQPGFIVHLLDTPVKVDPATALSQLAFRVFNFDITFSPAGKTAVTCTLPTRNVAYWLDLHRYADERYRAEKERLAESVIGALEKTVPELRRAIEVVDVSTPATVVRCTRNWQGSSEGWMPTPKSGFRTLPNTLPGLHNFIMAGQWVAPGGGLPGGLMTARRAVREICKRDQVAFATA